MSEESFDFESGELCLDFANTMNWHASQKPVEGLVQYSDLLAWGKAAGLISVELAAQLHSQAVEHPAEAEVTYRFAIQVREALYHIFSSLYAGKPVPEADLATLNNVVRQAMAHLQLAHAGHALRWEWQPGVDGADLILWPVARSAAELLTTGKLSQVRVCEDDRGCGYLFIDQSKNHSRRWCSMESCGNRAKARRHYSKTQGG